VTGTRLRQPPGYGTWPFCFIDPNGAGIELDHGAAEHTATWRNACGKALDIARAARDMLGGNGISDAFN
jgi:hypothetical protein